MTDRRTSSAKTRKAFCGNCFLMRSHVSNTEASYSVMKAAHSELVERERMHVQDESTLRLALLTIFHDTTDQTARVVAAGALGIKVAPTPLPKKPKKGQRT